MSISSSSAKDLAKLGANLTVTPESQYSSSSVKELIKIVTKLGKNITVHAGTYSSSSLKDFVKLGNGNITIVL